MTKFGDDFEKNWPEPAESSIKFTKFGRKLLSQCKSLKKPDRKNVDINKFITKSSKFPVGFGTNTCRVINQPRGRYPIIQQQIASAYPIIHEHVLALYLAFLEHKCQYGNAIEHKVYKKLNLTDFIERLLKKRCVAFLNADDNYLLISGREGIGAGRFENIGTVHEMGDLKLKHVLSYDEIKLSALLSVSSHTEFLNDGARQNAGIIENDKTKIELTGVIIGLIGARFERKDVMETQDVVISRTQNTKENGYGQSSEHEAKNRAESYRQLWTKFYDETDFLYETVQNLDSPRFYKSSVLAKYLDNLVLKKRYVISFDTLLLEAQARAKAADKQAYIHIVGIGLGCWRVVDYQTELFLLTFTQRLRALLPQLTHVGVAHFTWFNMTQCGELTDGGILASQAHPNGGIRTFLSDRNPAAKLPTEFENMLLVVSYAWDGNALPGNEFWLGSLTASGDPAAACSTLISEIHNAHINTEMVNGKNLHIATLKHGVMHIKDYAKIVLNKM